ncbi:hypothetical protein VTN00DRAFT_3154 [Thermoascus crustaceus]|uniref:uncharacterized protein n=1 Tax=Thermoascus crustaceus TaxID=5088 RepID=UPI0037442A0C
MAGDDQASLPYHEPDIITLLVQGCLILVLNIVNSVLDKFIYCGLIGQLFIGIAWGMPGGNWLTLNAQEIIQQLGFLGLILLVYEGGLSTSFSSLKANFLFSAMVATTGVCVPIGLSYILIPFVSANPLQAFAAGAALCTTSLGTTFTLLSTTGLIRTRVGVVLTGAAIMDDVAGLVMVQVIANLGNATTGAFSATTVVRPIFVSIGFALGLLLFCRFIARPILNKFLASNIPIPRKLKSFHFVFLVHTCILIGLVTGAVYAGTSNLFAAYLAGAVIGWFDEASGMAATNSEKEGVFQKPLEVIEMQVHHEHEARHSPSWECRDHISMDTTETEQSGRNAPPRPVSKVGEFAPTGGLVFEKFYQEPLNRILKPFFFASIGFSIPITEMFTGGIIWRGIVYSILMAFGKVITGFWLIRIPLKPALEKLIPAPLAGISLFPARPKRAAQDEKADATQNPSNQAEAEQSNQASQDDRQSDSNVVPHLEQSQGPATAAGAAASTENAEGNRPESDRITISPSSESASTAIPPKPRSLYPASILGLAMVARGEIGYLIASVAETNNVFTHNSSGSKRPSNTELYLVVVWAVSVCTLIGPMSVGTLVKRVKKLQRQREKSGGSDPLGVWGVE